MNATEPEQPELDVRRLSAWYGDRQAIDSIHLPIAPRRITAIIGPSGSGESPLLRCMKSPGPWRLQPRVLLMDEPASALDPISTAEIEHLMVELKAGYTIVMVTHNLQEAVRVSDDTAFLLAGRDQVGRLVEFGPTAQIFRQPHQPETADYVTGRFG